MSYIGNEPTSVAFLTDTFSGNGSTTAFTMSVAPATTSSVLVAITGVLQDPSTYSVSGTTLTFSAAPPSGTSNISVRYLGIPASGVTTTAYRTVTEFTATAGQTSFTVPSYTVGYVDVYRNGVMLGSADYTATTGTTIVLASGATAGDLVEVISFYVSSVLNAIPGTAGSVGTTYLADASVTQAKLGTNVAGTGPAFRAYMTGSGTTQSITSATWTKIPFNATDFNILNGFNTTTNVFSPTVAGYYQINGNVNIATNTNSGGYVYLAWYKNGSVFNYASSLRLVSTVIQADTTITASTLIYLNGTTDYVELAIYMEGSSPTINRGSERANMVGFLARAA